MTVDCDVNVTIAELPFGLVGARTEWIEEVLMGLHAAGCKRDDIELEEFEHDPWLVRIWVRGVLKYEWQGKFTVVK